MNNSKEIYKLILENSNTKNGIFNIISKKINDYVKNISNEKDAAKYIIDLYQNLINIPNDIKYKIIKYAFTVIVSIFGFNTIVSLLPSNVYAITNDYNTNKANDSLTINLTIPQKSSSFIKNFIKDEEKLRLNAYEIGDGMITIGWGHAEKKHKSRFKKSEKITLQKAQELFDADISKTEYYLNNILDNWKKNDIKININQNMYDAMISMIYNMGIGNFTKSKFLQLLKNNKLSEAKKEILNTKVKYKGVRERRKKESAIFGRGVISLNLKNRLIEQIKKEVDKLVT